jgi:hypothetical protein
MLPVPKTIKKSLKEKKYWFIIVCVYLVSTNKETCDTTCYYFPVKFGLIKELKLDGSSNGFQLIPLAAKWV